VTHRDKPQNSRVYNHSVPQYRPGVLNTNRTEIRVNYLISVDGDTVWVSWLFGQAHDRASIAAISAGREPRQAVISQC